ncbi:hypothetical protein D3C71_1608910 [compost metagenome]
MRAIWLGSVGAWLMMVRTITCGLTGKVNDTRCSRFARVFRSRRLGLSGNKMCVATVIAERRVMESAPPTSTTIAA